MKSDAAFKLTTAVMATADAFMRESQRLFRPHGLSGAQYNVLTILALNPDGMSQRELGDELVVDRSNVTGLLDRMGKAGWIKRDDEPGDRRVYRVTLSPAGRKLWEKIHPLYLNVAAQVTQGISPLRLRQTLDVLTHLQTGAVGWTLPGYEEGKP